MPNEEGKITFIGGDIYDGYWKNGEMHGKGTYTFADGTVYKGIFDNGEFIKKTIDYVGSIRRTSFKHTIFIDEN